MCICYDSLVANNGCLIDAILKGSEILQCKEAIFNKEKSQKDGKAEIQELYQERDKHIKSLLLSEFCPG